MSARQKHYALCVLAGLCLAAAQVPLGIWPLLLAGLALALWLARASVSPARAGWTGWVIGTAYFGASLSWIVEPFFVDAAAHAWMAPFALSAMAGGLALFWALPFWLSHRLSRPASVIALWPLAEYARSTVFTGFPWGLQAYAWIETPLAQIAGFVGPHGLGALVLSLIALPIFWRARIGGVIAVLGFAALALLGWQHARAVPESKENAPIIRLTQPNAPQHQKWDSAYAPIFFRRQLAATEASPRPDLIIWPETSLPSWLNDAEVTLQEIAKAAGGVPVLIGAQRYEEREAYNSLFELTSDGKIGQVYDKHHLVPFGEYLPFGQLLSRLGMQTLTRSFGGFTAGVGPALIELDGFGTLLPLICYEAVFPHQMQAENGARPDFVLHVTNDAWFGTWSGPYQHLIQARFRAIEQGLPMLRSANTGITAMIDARGAVLQSLPLGVAGHIDVPLPAPAAATVYSRFGDFPALIALIFLLCVTVLPYRTPRH